MSTTDADRAANAERIEFASNGAARMQMHLRAVRLELLDDAREPIVIRSQTDGSSGAVVASGFLVDEGGRFYICTCWHVVTGVNMHEPKLPGPLSPKRRMFVRVAMQDYTPGTGISIIGGERRFEVELYNPTDSPATPFWEQDAEASPSESLSLAGLLVPRWHDAVLLALPQGVMPSLHQTVAPVDCYPYALNVSDTVYLVGFPYGYSPVIGQPTPLVLTRTIAATRMRDTRSREFLIDGAGAPGMSGGPVFTGLLGKKVERKV